jgi:hypothetical protein
MASGTVYIKKELGIICSGCTDYVTLASSGTITDDTYYTCCEDSAV